MPKIVISNCWSYYNKGDAAIALSTAFNDAAPETTFFAVLFFTALFGLAAMNDSPFDEKIKYRPNLI